MNRPTPDVCGRFVTMKLLLKLPHLSLQLLELLLKLITMGCRGLARECGKLVPGVVLSRNVIDRDKNGRLGHGRWLAAGKVSRTSHSTCPKLIHNGISNVPF
jgi:hypothetical protein